MGKYNTFRDIRERAKYMTHKMAHNCEDPIAYMRHWDDYDALLGYIACDIMTYAKEWKKDYEFFMAVYAINGGIRVDCRWDCDGDEIGACPEYMIVGVLTEEDFKKAEAHFEKLASFFNRPLTEGSCEYVQDEPCLCNNRFFLKRVSGVYD